jgi:hypothetical protein
MYPRRTELQALFAALVGTRADRSDGDHVGILVRQLRQCHERASLTVCFAVDSVEPFPQRRNGSGARLPGQNLPVIDEEQRRHRANGEALRDRRSPIAA